MAVVDRGFWREVAVVGGLVAVAGGIVAIITGFTNSPFYVYGLVITGAGGALALFGGFLSGFLGRRRELREQRPREPKG